MNRDHDQRSTTGSRLDPSDVFGARLRRDAAALQRPAPEGLYARVMSAVIAEPREPDALVARPARSLRGVITLAGMVAAAVLVALVLEPKPVEVQRDPGPIERASEWVASIALPPADPRSNPLLAELEALGQDTTRAAAALARDLPGPVGALFRRRPR